MPLVRDVMTREVEFVEPRVLAREAAAKMSTQDLGALPVCEGGRLVGTLSDRDFTVNLVAAGRHPDRTRVAEVMNPRMVFCEEDQSLDEATALMEQRKAHRVFVVDREGRLTGIVSLGKVARVKSDRAAGRVVREISATRSRRQRR
jgi:CBS domain-containing protein